MSKRGSCICLRLLLLILFINGFVGSLFAQFNNQALNSEHRFWLTSGLGKTRFLSLNNGVSFQPRDKNFVLTGRYTVSGEFLSQTTPGLKISDAGLLYGLRVSNFIFSAGLSKVWGVDRGQYLGPAEPGALLKGDRYEKIQYSAIGIPLEARFLIPFKWMGIGITAYGNLNNGHSFGGVALSMYAGKL